MLCVLEIAVKLVMFAQVFKMSLALEAARLEDYAQSWEKDLCLLFLFLPKLTSTPPC